MKRNVLSVVGMALAVMVGWLATPAAIPLYDGVGFPDEPYRFVSAPPGVKSTPPVTVLLKPVSVKDGGNTSQFITSGEQGPQITLRLGAKAFLVPAGVTTITVKGNPVAPTDQPSFGEIEGNVYVLTAETGAGPAKRGTGFADIILREVIKAPKLDPIIAYRPRSGEAWQQLTTTRWGSDVFEAPLGTTGTGEYAVVNPPSDPSTGTTSAANTSSNTSFLVIGGAGLVALIAAVLLIVRFRTLRAAPAPAPKKRR